MRGKSFALLILALGCGLVASIGITQVISKQGDEPETPKGDTQAIFVALEDIAFGDPVTSQILRLEQWPTDKVPEDALTKIEDLEGRRTRGKIYAGEPILAKKLFEKGANALGVSTRIPKGYRVVSVQVDKVSGSASMIMPGDRVDVMLYLTRNPGTGTYQATTRTILQDVKVFAVNDVVGLESDQNDRSIVAQTISLLVTPEQAQEVMLASEMGKIRLVMRSPGDDAQSNVGESTMSKILGLADGANREQEKVGVGESKDTKGAGQGFQDFLNGLRTKMAAGQPAAPESAQPQAPRHEMRIITGGEVTHVLLESDGDPSGSGPQRWKIVGDGSASAPDETGSLTGTDAPDDERSTEDENEGDSTENESPGGEKDKY